MIRNGVVSAKKSKANEASLQLKTKDGPSKLHRQSLRRDRRRDDRLWYCQFLHGRPQPSVSHGRRRVDESRREKCGVKVASPPERALGQNAWLLFPSTSRRATCTCATKAVQEARSGVSGK